MRHNKKFNHLGRKSAHRKSMLANMSISLIQHKRISTTLAKAKALRMYVEPLLTKSKDDSTNSRRVVFSYLQNKEAVTELFQNVSQKIADRPGGYTRILRTGLRLGDAAEMCIIELVDYNENMLKEKATKKAARTRRSSVKKTDEKASTDAAAPAKAKAATAKAAPAKPAAKEAAPEKEAPVKEAPEKEAPVKEAPVKEAPAKEAPAEEAPVKETPAEDKAE